MKISKVLCAFLFLSYCTSMSAQLSKEQIKERKEIQKAAQADLSKKVSKAAKKEAKSMKKAGWLVTPGALPIEKQLDRSFTMQMEYDETLFPKYIMAEAMSIGETFDAAKMQAMELAKQNLAGQIQTEVAALVENSVANKQLSQEEAASVTKSIAAGRTLIIQSLGRVIPVMEVYRPLQNKNKEVLVRLAYNSDMAKAAAKAAVRRNLESGADGLQQRLDDILGW